MTTPHELFGDPEELNPNELLPAIRDLPAECDFCGNKTEPEELIAQSGDQWMCEDCWDRNEEQDRRSMDEPKSPSSFQPGLTTDRSDPRLGHGSDNKRVSQNEVYLVLSEEERAKGFIRPVRRSYRHSTCQGTTTMGIALCETYARNPKFYGSTYCTICQMHKPVREFNWVEDGSIVGS